MTMRLRELDGREELTDGVLHTFVDDLNNHGVAGNFYGGIDSPRVWQIWSVQYEPRERKIIAYANLVDKETGSVVLSQQQKLLTSLASNIRIPKEEIGKGRVQ